MSALKSAPPTADRDGQVSEMEDRYEGPTRRPQADILETDFGFRVMVNMPGADRDSVHVTVADDRLEVTGLVPEDQTDERRETFRREFSPMPWRRSFRLGRDLDSDSIRATMEDGVLSLEVNRRSDLLPRRIEVA